MPAMENDSVCHQYPYFDIKPGMAEKFKGIWFNACPSTKASAESEKTHMYAFAFDKNTALCREAYADAESLLLHVNNVDTPLKAALDPSVAKLLRLEVHGPASELAKLKEALTPLGAEFFELEWGFRNPI